MSVLNEILASEGSKELKTLHLKKQAKRRSGDEIIEVHCDAESILQAKKFFTTVEGHISTAEQPNLT